MASPGIERDTGQGPVEPAPVAPNAPPAPTEPSALPAPTGIRAAPVRSSPVLLVGVLVASFLLIGLGVAAFVLIVGGKATAGTPSAGEPERGQGSLVGSSRPAETTDKLQLRDSRFFTGQAGGNLLYMVAEIQNVSATAVGTPEAKVTLNDAAGNRVSTSTCNALIRALAPGKSIPCAAVFSDVKTWKTSQVELEAEPTPALTPAQVTASEIVYSSSRKAGEPHTLSGRITNTGSSRAKSVWAIVGLYDQAGKIAGVGTGPVDGTDLEPGASASFKVSIYAVAAPIDRYVVTPVGYQ
jgi:hypothetical protein